MFVLLDKRLSLVQGFAAQADILCQFNLWFQPELGLTLGVVYMHMHAWLFTGKEKEAKPISPKNGWCHK